LVIYGATHHLTIERNDRIGRVYPARTKPFHRNELELGWVDILQAVSVRIGTRGTIDAVPA
jgi:hypothetical protein